MERPLSNRSTFEKCCVKRKLKIKRGAWFATEFETAQAPGFRSSFREREELKFRSEKFRMQQSLQCATRCGVGRFKFRALAYHPGNEVMLIGEASHRKAAGFRARGDTCPIDMRRDICCADMRKRGCNASVFCVRLQRALRAFGRIKNVPRKSVINCQDVSAT